MKDSTKGIIKRVVLYSIIYISVLLYFNYIKFIDYATIRRMYIPILGISIIAIILDYSLFGRVILVANLFGLIAEYTIITKQGIDAIEIANYTNNSIIIIGFVFGFAMQTYIKQKKK